MKRDRSTASAVAKQVFDPEQHQFIVLDDISLGTQLKVYEKLKILYPHFEIDEENIVHLDRPYWTYNIEGNEFIKCRESDVSTSVDFHTNTLNEFIKAIKSSIVLKEETFVGDYTAEVYVDKVKVGCQTITREEVENVLEIMNKLKNK